MRTKKHKSYSEQYALNIDYLSNFEYDEGACLFNKKGVTIYKISDTEATAMGNKKDLLAFLIENDYDLDVYVDFYKINQ